MKSRKIALFLLPPLSLVFTACGSSNAPPVEGTSTASLSASSLRCDVIVAGGTAAALAAALASAREGAHTCLVEPTDWLGGQLTASGVPAIDFAWKNLPGYAMADTSKQPANLSPDLVSWLNIVGDPGQCSVSKNCFEPKNLLTQAIYPAVAREQNLVVLKNTVVKRVFTKNGLPGKRAIASIEVVRRTPTQAASWGGYDVRLSSDMLDWYSETDSPRYTKEVITLSSLRAAGPVVIDATELGDVLVLSGAAYMQGVETSDGSATAALETCGQAFTFPFAIRNGRVPAPDDLPNVSPDHPEDFGWEGKDWAYVWRYRRLAGAGEGAHPDEISSQNWRLGNDYAHGYLLKSKAAAALEVADWHGGVNLSALEAAERQAYGWFRWFRDHTPAGAAMPDHLALARDVSGTGHGLAKFPYVRDTRRSIGVGDFILRGSDLADDGSGLTGKRFIDRVAIGLYSADMHPMAGCAYPDYLLHDWDPLPFYIPLRALTNRDVTNLLVAGKTMAQSFRANEATRLHPIEISSGMAAGAAAATMSSGGFASTNDLVAAYAKVQGAAKKYTPIDWTIDGVTYPRPGEQLEPIASGHLFCPPGAQADLNLGYCVDADNAYGPFTRAMESACNAEGGGPACAATMAFTISGHVVNIPRWNRAFAGALRGSAECMNGAHKDAVTGICVEDASASASGVKEAYGPFDASVVQRCFDANGGDACYTNRWSYAFYTSLIR